MVVEPLLASDFELGVVQVVCLLNDDVLHLVFASAELLPTELPRPAEEPPMSLRVRRLGPRAQVFYRRYVTTALEALTWYQDCRAGKFGLLQDDVHRETAHEPLYEEPSWPQLVVSNKFPISGDVPSVVRAHHLIPQDMPRVLKELFAREPAAAPWISDRLFFNLLRYPEYAGSVHLLVPNPVYRTLHVRLHVAENGRESTAIEVTPREGMSAEGLQVTVIQHRPTGISECVTQAFGKHPFMLVPHYGQVEQVEMLLVCPHRGVLEQQEPTGFVRGFSLNLQVEGGRKRVAVPGAQGATVDSYEVPVVERADSSSYMPANGGPPSVPARLRLSEFERARNDEAERLGQKWFQHSKSEATAFVRSLVGSAKSRVWIVDPYFATSELFSFALATRQQDVEVLILTGAATAMVKPDLIDSTVTAGEQLLSVLTAQSNLSHVKVRVMLGDTPAVHDRFLVIDNAVWFTGNSLNNIGERAGMMISVPAPDVVISKLHAILTDTTRTKDLADWVAARRVNTP